MPSLCTRCEENKNEPGEELCESCLKKQYRQEEYVEDMIAEQEMRLQDILKEKYIDD